MIKNMPDKEIKADLIRFLPVNRKDIGSKIKSLVLGKIEGRFF